MKIILSVIISVILTINCENLSQNDVNKNVDKGDILVGVNLSSSKESTEPEYRNMFAPIIDIVSGKPDCGLNEKSYCNYNCEKLTCANHKTEMSDFLLCVAKNEYINSSTFCKFHGKQWSPCICKLDFVRDEETGLCIPKEYCAKLIAPTQRPTTLESNNNCYCPCNGTSTTSSPSATTTSPQDIPINTAPGHPTVVTTTSTGRPSSIISSSVATTSSPTRSSSQFDVAFNTTSSGLTAHQPGVPTASTGRIPINTAPGHPAVVTTTSTGRPSSIISSSVATTSSPARSSSNSDIVFNTTSPGVTAHQPDVSTASVGRPSSTISSSVATTSSPTRSSSQSDVAFNTTSSGVTAHQPGVPTGPSTTKSPIVASPSTPAILSSTSHAVLNRSSPGVTTSPSGVLITATGRPSSSNSSSVATTSSPARSSSPSDVTAHPSGIPTNSNGAASPSDSSNAVHTTTSCASPDYDVPSTTAHDVKPTSTPPKVSNSSPVIVPTKKTSYNEFIEIGFDAGIYI